MSKLGDSGGQGDSDEQPKVPVLAKQQDGSPTASGDDVSGDDVAFVIGDIEIPQKYAKFLLPGGIALSAVFIVAPIRFATSIVSFVLTTIGVTLGVGFGLGLAMHVYEHLQQIQRKQSVEELQKKRRKRLKKCGSRSISDDDLGGGGGAMLPSKGSLMHSRSTGSNSVLEDGNTYLSLMAASGYPVEDKVLRAQVIRDSADFWKRMYPFTSTKVEVQLGPRLVQSDWPSLPQPIATQLGRFIEHVVRDYVGVWYTKLDGGCVSLDEKQRRQLGISRDGGDPDGNANNEADDKEKEGEKQGQDDQQKAQKEAADDTEKTKTEEEPQEEYHFHHHQRRSMVFSTKTHRRSPMLDQTYRVLSVMFGNLAARAEHVNLFSLMLLKWTRVLAHTFKVYRNMRKAAMDKNQFKIAQSGKKTSSGGGGSRVDSGSNRKSAAASLASAVKNKIESAAEKLPPPTEIQVTREFLLAGKLHTAVTFGLDVPSLLFADANGKECGSGVPSDDSVPSSYDRSSMDYVLEQRLFRTNLLQECELDYNRVVAFRLCRALLPRNEFSSNLLSSLVVEIFSGCVLQPLMGIFTPVYLNGWIIAGIDKSKGSSVPEGEESDINENAGQTLDGRKAAETREGSVDLGDTETRSLDDSVDDPLDLDLVDPLDAVDPAAFDPMDTDEGLDVVETEGPPGREDRIQTFASTTLIDLQKHVDFEDCKQAKIENREELVNWDNATIQTSVLRLVLVLEAAILDGRCNYSSVAPHAIDDGADTSSDVSGREKDELSSVPMYESLSQALMEMTSDIDGFESRVHEINKDEKTSKLIDYNTETEYAPDANEVSTLRTLILTWLHTGQLYRSLSVLVEAHQSVLLPFYKTTAFLATTPSADKFMKEMKSLDGVEVMVDTMAVLASPRLDLDGAHDIPLSAAVPSSAPPPASDDALGSLISSSEAVTERVGAGLGLLKQGLSQGLSEVSNRLVADVDPRSSATTPADEMAAYMSDGSTPRHLNFHRNSAFAASLRDERERRMRSWETRKGDDAVQTVHHKGASATDKELHNELHSVAKIFYNGTNVMALRDAARRKDSEDSEGADRVDNQAKVSLLTVEMVSNRRRIEVPDDDSSFLLRAQPRALNPVSVHRDDRNHDLSYKCFLATFEEPAFTAGSNRYNGGRYIRRCLLQYYPIDRTASISMNNDGRKLDRRKGKQPSPELSTSKTSIPYLKGDFLRRRHLCQKWSPKGAPTQNFLSSSVMELSDLNASPRSGKALDFIYRMSLFERPVVDLDGKRFTVHDSSGRGPHRADASALEISDASLSALLLVVGRDWEIVSESDNKDNQNPNGEDHSTSVNRHPVEMGPDGYPMIFMKFSQKQGDKVSFEIKPYRASFIRAALMVTSARQEAQLQCLVDCVRAGSAKSATKARTELRLKPTLKMLHFANDDSTDKSRASSLLRDLKLGVYHIDRDQLRRNGLLSPRHPAMLRDLAVKIDGVFQAKDVLDASSLGTYLTPTSAVYKLVCSAVVELGNIEEAREHVESYSLKDGSLGRLYTETWVVFRSMRDFQLLHKHIKSQVANSESSASTGSRLVGAATAAFGNTAQGRRQRKALVPSLAQASKTGAIGGNKKSLLKRAELLDEYLVHFLSPGHLLSRCPEILLFVGAFYPFPSEVRVDFTPPDLVDPMGRVNLMRRLDAKNAENADVLSSPEKNKGVRSPEQRRKGGKRNSQSTDSTLQDDSEFDESNVDDESIDGMLENVLSKVEQVPLADVRNRMVELIRYQFGFENASFFRSRLLAALETASFVAMTKQSNFRKLLYNLHMKQLSSDALANWIKMVMDLLWPDGVWMEKAPTPTLEEERNLAATSREKLHEVFPDSIMAILGKELTRDGMDMLHEMLQNRLVVKSLFYMLFDMLWIEIFPELSSDLTCAAALDIE